MSNFMSNSDALQVLGAYAEDIKKGKGVIAVRETSPATAAHGVGEYVRYNGTTYKVKSAISIGDSLILNTNIEANGLPNGTTIFTPETVGDPTVAFLDDLGDVAISNLLHGQILLYNSVSARFQNANIPSNEIRFLVTDIHDTITLYVVEDGGTTRSATPTDLLDAANGTKIAIMKAESDRGSFTADTTFYLTLAKVFDGGDNEKSIKFHGTDYASAHYATVSIDFDDESIETVEFYFTEFPYAVRPSSFTSGNLASLTSSGNLADSGYKGSDFLTSHQDISGKADKVSSATNGNFAGLDANGNLTDSGKKASDFMADGTVGVAKGGTGATTLTSGAALIGNGTGAVTTRAITNNTSKSTAPSGSTNLATMNSLLYGMQNYNNRASAVNSADTNYTTAMARAIYATTTDLTAGTTALTNGTIALVYE